MRGIYNTHGNSGRGGGGGVIFVLKKWKFWGRRGRIKFPLWWVMDIF